MTPLFKSLFFSALILSGFSSCSKQDTINPTGQDAKSASISYVKITEMSFTSSDGTGFDDNNGPDAYIIIKDRTTGDQIYKSAVVMDVKPGEQPTWSFKEKPLALPNVNKNYSIELYDQDGLLDADDFIGKTDLNISDNISKNPKTIKSDGNVPKFETELVWGF